MIKYVENKIVTDSTADIPKFLLEKYAVSFVPLKVFGEECYREDIDLSSGEFYEKLATFEEYLQLRSHHLVSFVNVIGIDS